MFIQSAIPIARPFPIVALVAVGYLLLALIMSYIFPKITLKGSMLVKGLKYGITFSILWTLPYNLVLHGAYEFPEISLIIDPLWALVEQGIGSIFIAIIHEKVK